MKLFHMLFCKILKDFSIFCVETKQKNSTTTQLMLATISALDVCSLFFFCQHLITLKSANKK